MQTCYERCHRHPQEGRVYVLDDSFLGLAMGMNKLAGHSYVSSGKTSDLESELTC